MSREGAGSAALVVGVVAVGVAVFPLLFWAGWLLGVAAVALGLVALRRVRAGLATGRGAALAGLALGVTAIPLGLVGMLVLQAAFTGRTAA